MGVAKDNEVAPIRIIGEIGDYDLSDSGDEIAFHARQISVEQLNQIPIGRKHAMSPRKPKTFREEVETGGVNVKRNMGSRKWRRVELARNMLNFTELEDICEDFSDVFHQPYSAFDKLFADRQNMKKWNDFIEKDEVEQRKILENGGNDIQEEQSGSGWAVLGGKTFTPTKKTTPRKTTDESPDKRKHHPAYSGKACFDRIDSRGKGTLMGRRVNWALIDHLETELRSLFSMNTTPTLSDADTIFVAHYPASSDRFLAHIISQYLWLTSQSVTDPSTGDRITEIRNPRTYFIPPHVRLINYLEENVVKKKIDFIPYSMREVEVESENGNDSLAISEELNQLNISTCSDDEWVNVHNKST